MSLMKVRWCRRDNYEKRAEKKIGWRDLKKKHAVADFYAK